MESKDFIERLAESAYWPAIQRRVLRELRFPEDWTPDQIEVLLDFSRFHGWDDL